MCRGYGEKDLASSSQNHLHVAGEAKEVCGVTEFSCLLASAETLK